MYVHNVQHVLLHYYTACMYIMYNMYYYTTILHVYYFAIGFIRALLHTCSVVCKVTITTHAHGCLPMYMGECT